MKALFDTSVLVAALLQSHTRHSPAAAWLRSVKQGKTDLVVSAHSLAELYSSLTGMPLRPQPKTGNVWTLIEADVVRNATIRTLSAKEYQKVVKRLAHEGLRGGVIYDAVIARIAELIQVDVLLTLNTSDFERVWPSGVGRIVSPLTAEPP